MATILLGGSETLAKGLFLFNEDAVPHYRSETAMAELESTYTIKEVLGQGAFGIVTAAEHKATKQLFACKIIKKRLGATSAYEQQEREVGIMKSIKHDKIIQLHAVYECPNKIALILELCKGGELLKAIREQEFCSDETIRDIVTQLVDAVSWCILMIAYLHRNRIIHRDIKPENILLEKKAVNNIYTIKMADFGLACFADATNPVDNIAGTPMYMAPEIVQKLGYNHQADIWSIGVMLYLLLCQYDKEAEHMLHEMIKIQKIEYPPKFWATVDQRAKNLCELILRFDPAMRISAGEIKSHPWITNHHGAQITGNVIDLMRSYNAERRLKKGIRAVIGHLRFLKAGITWREKQRELLVVEETAKEIADDPTVTKDQKCQLKAMKPSLDKKKIKTTSNQATKSAPKEGTLNPPGKELNRHTTTKR